MPTAWDPWPGNISASLLIMTPSRTLCVDATQCLLRTATKRGRDAAAAPSQLPLGEARAPREPGAEPGHQQRIALLQAAVLAGLVQADRDGGARGVAVAVQVGEHLRLGESQTPRRGLDDADVGLVRHEQVDVFHGQPGVAEHLLARADHRARGELEDLAARHVHGVLVQAHRLVARRLAAAAGRHVEIRRAAAVVAQVEAEDAAVVGGLHEHGAGAVAEEHAGAAVLPVDHLAEHLGADNEDVLVDVGRNEGRGDGEAVDEAGAAGLHVEGAGLGGADLVGDDRRRGRHDVVGRDRGDDDQVELARDERPRLETTAGGDLAEVARRLVHSRDAALADAGAREDPLVRRVEELRDLGVGQHALRHVDAERRDARPAHQATAKADHSFASPASMAAASTIANMSSPRQASWPSTVALTLARPTGPCTATTSASRRMVSPGFTTRLKRTLSMPAKRPILPLRNPAAGPGAASAAPPLAAALAAASVAVWASASTMSTPGITGLPGKCPANQKSSSRNVRAATQRTPGSSSSTSSTSRNGGRCGSSSRIWSRSSFTAASAPETGARDGARGRWPRPRPRGPSR